MEIIDTYAKAFNIAKPYIEHLNDSVIYPFTSPNSSPMPPEIENTKWSMTLTSLENTLKYIFEYLHHPCHMLCIRNNQAIIYRLKMGTSSASMYKLIKDVHFPKMLESKMITKTQKKIIKNRMIGPFRVLQCLIKKRDLPQPGLVKSPNQYIQVLQGMKLPNGVFIINQTDSVILTNDGTHPFYMVTGKQSLGKYDFSKYLPILSLSGQYGYADIPIPGYEDIEYVYNTQLYEKNISQFNTIWENKTIQKAVFRGGSTGCGYTPETNMRLKVSTLKSKYIDAGIVREINTPSVKFDPIYGLGMINLPIKPVSFMTMNEQSNYKYIIHIDGNVTATRLLTTMITGSLILRVGSIYTSWVDHMLFPNVHYLPIKPDLSDLETKIKWCIKNDDKCKIIAQNGFDFAKRVLVKDFIQSYIQKMVWSLSDYTDIVSKSVTKTKKHRKRCPNGTKRNKQTNRCKKHQDMIG